MALVPIYDLFKPHVCLANYVIFAGTTLPLHYTITSIMHKQKLFTPKLRIQDLLINPLFLTPK